MQEKEKSAGKGQKRKLVSGTSSQSSKRLSGLTDATLSKTDNSSCDHYSYSCSDHQCHWIQLFWKE